MVREGEGKERRASPGRIGLGGKGQRAPISFQPSPSVPFPQGKGQRGSGRNRDWIC